MLEAGSREGSCLGCGLGAGHRSIHKRPTLHLLMPPAGADPSPGTSQMSRLRHRALQPGQGLPWERGRGAGAARPVLVRVGQRGSALGGEAARAVQLQLGLAARGSQEGWARTPAPPGARCWAEEGGPWTARPDRGGTCCAGRRGPRGERCCPLGPRCLVVPPSPPQVRPPPGCSPEGTRAPRSVLLPGRWFCPRPHACAARGPSLDRHPTGTLLGRGRCAGPALPAGRGGVRGDGGRGSPSPDRSHAPGFRASSLPVGLAALCRAGRLVASPGQQHLPSCDDHGLPCP